jgi:transposase
MTRAEIQVVYEAGPEAVIGLVERLLAVIAEQQTTIVALTARVQRLEEQLARNSHNSSKPPASDGFARKTKSRREKSGKPPGGQPGHEGQTLRAVEAPDLTVSHLPQRCAGCDAGLGGVEPTDLQHRQVFDLPPLSITVTEHVAGSKACPACGQLNRGEFPAWVTQPVQYGPHLLSLLVYLLVYQLLPYSRVSELVQDLFGQAVAGGTLFTAVGRCYVGLARVAAQIQAAVGQAHCAQFDETGVRIGGKLCWWHTASTPTLTHYTVHPKRGREGSDAGGVLPHFAGIAVHDAWSPYFQYGCPHALCNAHHLRELQAAGERDGQAWTPQLIALLVGAQREVAAARAAGASALAAGAAAAIREEYRRLVAAGLEANPPAPAAEAAAGSGPRKGRPAQSATRNLLLRLERYEAETLRFLSDFAVPFDNNLAERDLRMLKVQQKVSGCFRSEIGALWFGRIRGYLSTMRKQKQPMLAAIASVFQGRPSLPQFSA